LNSEEKIGHSLQSKVNQERALLAAKQSEFNKSKTSILELGADIDTMLGTAGAVDGLFMDAIDKFNADSNAISQSQTEALNLNNMADEFEAKLDSDMEAFRSALIELSQRAFVLGPPICAPVN
jgi:hypothetical protein